MQAAFPTEIFIFKERVITVIAGGKATATEIKSWQNAKKYREFFDAVWISER